MKSLVKSRQILVKLTATEEAELKRLVRIEKVRRGDPQLGRATLLRELAMPAVRERLALTEQAAA